jgi:hypothetical protein
MLLLMTGFVTEAYGEEIVAEINESGRCGVGGARADGWRRRREG